MPCFQVGEQKFSAHRIVLAASIPYFHAMFTHDMLEAGMDSITIGTCGVEPTALEALLNFSYTGKLVITGANPMSSSTKNTPAAN